MIAYRIYALDEEGHRSAGNDVVCLNDHDALRLAQTCVRGEARAEIWSATRFVGTVCAMIAVVEMRPVTLPVNR